MLANMITSLFESERIETTVPKAKEAKRLAERMITFARRGNAAFAKGEKERLLAARRHVARTIQDSDVLRKLFAEIAPRFAERPGGYTRIVRLSGCRVGDNAPRAMLELLKNDEEGRKKKKTPRKTYHKVEMPAAPVKAEAPKGSAEAAEKPAEASAEAAAAAPEAAKAEAPHAAKPKAHKAEREKKAKPKAAEKPKGKK